jgi:hypothetical protein
MRITINPIYQWDDTRNKYVLVSHDGTYEYSGPVNQFCSSGGDVGKSDAALQAAQTTMTQNLNNDYNQTFLENQQVAKTQIAKAQALMSNPMGLSVPEMASARSSIVSSTARSAQQALGSAAAFAASRGGGSSDIGGGSIGQIAGEIGSEAAQSKSQQLSALSMQDQEMKRQSFLTGLSELNNAGANLSGQSGTAIGGATSTADTAVKAGTGELAAKQADWSNISGMISGIGGLALSGVGIGGNIAGGRPSFQ